MLWGIERGLGIVSDMQAQAATHRRGNAGGLQHALGRLRPSRWRARHGSCHGLGDALTGILVLPQHLAPGRHIKVVIDGLVPVKVLQLHTTAQGEHGEGRLAHARHVTQLADRLKQESLGAHVMRR